MIPPAIQYSVKYDPRGTNPNTVPRFDPVECSIIIFFVNRVQLQVRFYLLSRRPRSYGHRQVEL
jgi:hypothetical protein